jgi:hypothetical protein
MMIKQNNSMMKKALLLVSAVLLMTSDVLGRERTKAEMDSIANSVPSAITNQARSMQGKLTKGVLCSDAAGSAALNRHLKEVLPDVGKGRFHHNANDRFGLKVSQTLHPEVILLGKKDKKLFVYFVFFLLIRTFVM